MVQIKNKDGGVIDVPLPEPDTGPRVVVFGLHKAASVLMDLLIEELLSGKRASFNVGQYFFEQGIPFKSIPRGEQTRIFLNEGMVYYGMRVLLRGLSDLDLSRAKRIVMVRDPRDILTSYYYSMAFSHGLPKTGVVRDLILRSRDAALRTEIGEFVLSSSTEFLCNNYHRIVDFVKQYPDTTVFRYEDVIFNKRIWVKQLCDILELDYSDQFINNLADRHDLRPKSEDTRSHVRRVKPGSFQDHLSPQIISRIEEKYKAAMDFFNYQSFKHE